MHILHDSPKALSANVVYPSGYNSKNPLYEYDIEYLKSRILTYRSAHSKQIDPTTSQYYEGAKTLVELLDIICRFGVVNEIYNMHISLNNEPGKFPESRVNFIMRTTQLADIGGPEQQINVEITLLYTGKTDHTCGMFIIAGHIVELDSNNEVIYRDKSKFFTVGDTDITTLYNNIPDTILSIVDMGKCFKAGEILKYSENFPTYSKLSDDIIKGIISISDN